MMTHLEGPIVDSFYDVCLTSWHNELKPRLPCYDSPAALGGLPSFDQASHATMFDRKVNQPKHIDLNEHYASTAGNGTNAPAYASDQSSISDPKPLASVVNEGNNARLPEHTSTDPHYDNDIASEVCRSQSVLTPLPGESRMNAVTRHLNTTIQPNTKGNAPECEPGEEMTPLIPHPQHEPVPMAMVCRKPWGAPNHSCVHTPQNEAFLSCLRNAQKSVFIQTPNLNAEPLLPAIIAAVERGVEVTIYVCLGYNDAVGPPQVLSMRSPYLIHILSLCLATAFTCLTSSFISQLPLLIRHLPAHTVFFLHAQ